jgi:hypothetical protein
VKDAEAIHSANPLEEAKVEVPTTLEPVTTAPRNDDVNVSTPTREKEHFKFGKLFASGSKDRAKSPAAAEKMHEPVVDAVAPQIQDTTGATDAEPIQPIVAAPVVESQPEPVVAGDNTPAIKKEKRGSIFQTLGRSLSKATGKKDAPKEKKEAVSSVPEINEEEKSSVPALQETPATENAVPGSTNVDEAPKLNPTVASTA